MDLKACRVGELGDGEMREVGEGERTVLLARHEGRHYALSPHCTHYGAPLVDGVLSDGRIICPWHHACFDATSGAMIEPPALDSLAAFPVRVDGDEVIVELPEEIPDRVAPSAPATAPDDERTIVIVGGGAAGYMAAQTLRECGEAGRIVMITPEQRRPYDRPNLSKDYLHGHADPAWMPLRDDEFYAAQRIEIERGRRVTRLDAAARTITLDDGSTLGYTAAIVATGCSPRRLDVPGADLRNVFTLRSFDDADAIIAASNGARRAIVVGASFIAMEAACSLRLRGLDVTVVAPDSVPFAKTLGAEIGGLFRSEHEKHGVMFRLGNGVASIEGKDSVETVVLENGERLEADIVVAGIGVTPITDFIEGVEIDERGGILVDASMRAADGLYAAGDIAAFPDARTGERIRIEHWRTALQLGRIAARNVAGSRAMYDAIPFFWTQQFDLTLRYVGHVREWDEITVDGDLAARDFLACYMRDGRVAAAASVGRDRAIIETALNMRASNDAHR
jgi:apoptosis-inducing factor 3